MADRIVQPKVLVSTNPDTYDNLIMQQAQNATDATNVTTNINGNAISDIFESNGTTVKNATNADNAIKKTDNTYGGLMLDENGVLKFGDIIIPQKKTLWTGSTLVSNSVDIQLPTILKVGDKLRIKGQYGTTGNTLIFEADIVISAIVDYNATAGDTYYPYYEYCNCSNGFAFGDIDELYIFQTYINNQGLLRVDELEAMGTTSVSKRFTLLNIWQIIE